MKNPTVQNLARANLIKAAETLFSKHGFHGTSIRSLTQAAKTNVASIHYHFGDKYGLYEATLVAHFEEIRSEIENVKLYQKTPHEQLLIGNEIMQRTLISKECVSRMIFHILMSRDEKLRKITKTIMEKQIKPMLERLQFASHKCRWKGAKAGTSHPDIFVFLIMALNSYWFLFSKELHSLFNRPAKTLLAEAFSSIRQLLESFTEEI